MKLRTDYVTNSSSSSFIIAYRSLPEIDSETIAKYPFLKNYCKYIESVLFEGDWHETSDGYVYNTKEEWNERMLDYFCVAENENLADVLEEEDGTEMYNEAIKYLERGWHILEKSVGYGDTRCYDMINTLAQDKDNFIIVAGDD